MLTTISLFRGLRRAALPVLSGIYALFSPGSVARADVRPAALFTDNLVLQREKPLPVWGKAEPGETVTVTFGKSAATKSAGPDGAWSVTLPPQKVATGQTLVVAGKNTITFRNIAVGDVWVCSGQSNMEFPLSKGRDAEAEIAGASYPDIRLFKVQNAASDTPQDDIRAVGGGWKACSPDSARSFAAVAYFFGRELHKRLKVPIGLIQSDWGGTPAEAWTSRSALETSLALAPLLPEWEARLTAYPETRRLYDAETLPKWQAEADKALAAGKRAPQKPPVPDGPDSANRPTRLFNAMISPLIPFGIKGVIWYQGEGNADTMERAIQYRVLFPALIRDWRSRWKQGDFPFLFVQLANWLPVQTKPVEVDSWPVLREAQAGALSLPHTGMATAIDLADLDHPNDIHPKNKQDVGLRLALVALAKEYGVKVAHSGPVLEKMDVKGRQAILRFRHADGGLKSRDNVAPRGFAIAGADGVWRWADATINPAENTITLTNADIPAPVAVRYNWARNPIGTLMNGVGLPAIPFRTDTKSPD